MKLGILKKDCYDEWGDRHLAGKISKCTGKLDETGRLYIYGRYINSKYIDLIDFPDYTTTELTKGMKADLNYVADLILSTSNITARRSDYFYGKAFTFINGKLSDYNGDTVCYFASALRIYVKCEFRLLTVSYLLNRLGYDVEYKNNRTSLIESNGIPIITLNVRYDYYATIGNKLLSNEFADIIYGLNGRAKDIIFNANGHYNHPKNISDLRIEKGGKTVSYVPPGKQHGVDKLRQSMKLGKIFNKLKLAEVSVSQIESFINDIKGQDISDCVFNIVKGEDIRKYYKGNKYYDNQATLTSSCMRHDKCQSYFDLYTLNTKVCSMLLLKQPTGDKILGRALLWETNDGNKVMDRIYGKDATISMFKTWAKDNGYIRKARQSYENNYDWVLPDGGEVNRKFTVNLENVSFDRYPYVDSLYYFSKDDKTLSTIDEASNYFTLRETNGSGSGDNRVWDEYDEDYIDEEDAVHIDDYGYTHYDNTYEDEYSGDTILRDDGVEVLRPSGDTDITHVDRTVHDEINDCHIMSFELITLIDGRGTLNNGDVYYSVYDNENYHKSNVVLTCAYSQTDFLKEGNGETVFIKGIGDVLKEYEEEATKSLKKD